MSNRRWLFLLGTIDIIGLMSMLLLASMTGTVLAYVSAVAFAAGAGFAWTGYFDLRARDKRLGRVLAHEDLKSIYNKKEGKR